METISMPGISKARQTADAHFDFAVKALGRSDPFKAFMKTPFRTISSYFEWKQNLQAKFPLDKNPDMELFGRLTQAYEYVRRYAVWIPLKGPDHKSLWANQSLQPTLHLLKRLSL